VLARSAFRSLTVKPAAMMHEANSMVPQTKERTSLAEYLK
jgi:hypothetical protein